MTADLKRRLITALPLGVLGIVAILWAPTPIFALLLGVIVAIAAWEWAALCGVPSWVMRLAYALAVTGAAALFWLWPQWQQSLLLAAVIWWSVQAARLPRVISIESRADVNWVRLAVGLLVLTSFWVALVSLHATPQIGALLLLFLMILIVAADSSAYFVGRAWGGGRAKLAPLVSPGKTRVGVYGALVSALVCALGLAWWWSASLTQSMLILLVCGVVVPMSIVGDLYESLLKRQRGLKDSGRLLPGHGGLLDRIDSLMAAAPLFALGMGMVLALA